MPVSKIHHGLVPRVCESPIGVKSPAAVGSSSSSEGSPQQVDRSTLVLSYAPTPAAAAGAATSLVQNYASSIVAWSDVFDVHAVPCDAWWLRGACADDGSELCVGDVDQLRAMSSRLARAATLAESGGKWGLLQAVLLSWDSAPASAQSWVRQQIALEACGLLILPAAAEGLQADLKAAWEALPGKEQQLWCQLQQARLMHSRRDMRQAGVTHYTIDRPAIAALLQRASGVPEAGALLAEPAMGIDMDLAALNMFPNAATRRRNMDASYTALLLCCRVYGTSHPRTQEALEDTRVTDPQGWVPLLLAGLAYPSLTRAPGVRKGSKEEATAYVFNHGMAWEGGPSTSPESLMAHYGPHVTWLLQQRSNTLPSKAQQGDLRHLRLLNCGQVGHACQGVFPLLDDILESGATAAVGSTSKVGVTRIVRTSLVFLGSLDHITYNLPPCNEAPERWQAVATILKQGIERRGREKLGPFLLGLTQHAYQLAVRSLQVAPLLRGSGLWQPHSEETANMQAFLADLRSSACRVYWQLGNDGMAQRLAQEGVAEQPDSGSWRAIQAFLMRDQQAAYQLAASSTGASSPNTKNIAYTGRQAGAGSSSSSRPSPRGAAKKQCSASHGTLPQGSLFGSFPGWVDQLVSQVVGRPVKLAIDVEHPPDSSPGTMFMRVKPHAEVYLVEADGSKVPFSWWAGPGGSSNTTVTTAAAVMAETNPTTTTGSGSDEAAPLTLMPGPLPAEDVYEKYLLPGVADSAQQMQAWDSANSSPATTTNTTPTNSQQGTPSGGRGHAQAAGGSNGSSGGNAPTAAAAGGSSTSSSTSRASQAPHTRPMVSTSISNNSMCFSFGNVTMGIMTLDGLEEMVRGVRSAPDGEDSEESLDDADGSGYDPLRGISISSERLTAALSAVGLGDMLRDLNTGPGQGGSAGPVQHGPSSTHTPAVPASSASEAAGSRVGSRAAAATQAASGTAQSDVAAGGATSAAVAAPDTAVGPGHTSGGDGNAAEGGAVSPGGRKKPRPCAMCGQLFTKLHRCARCKEVLYCSREHQVAHWKLVHKLECQQK